MSLTPRKQHLQIDWQPNNKLPKDWKLFICNSINIEPNTVKIYKQSKLVVCRYKTTLNSDFWGSLNNAIWLSKDKYTHINCYKLDTIYKP